MSTTGWRTLQVAFLPNEFGDRWLCQQTRLHNSVEEHQCSFTDRKPSEIEMGQAWSFFESTTAYECAELFDQMVKSYHDEIRACSNCGKESTQKELGLTIICNLCRIELQPF